MFESESPKARATALYHGVIGSDRFWTRTQTISVLAEAIRQAEFRGVRFAIDFVHERGKIETANLLRERVSEMQKASLDVRTV